MNRKQAKILNRIYTFVIWFAIGLGVGAMIYETIYVLRN